MIETNRKSVSGLVMMSNKSMCGSGAEDINVSSTDDKGHYIATLK